MPTRIGKALGYMLTYQLMVFGVPEPRNRGNMCSTMLCLMLHALISFPYCHRPIRTQYYLLAKSRFLGGLLDL